MTMPLSLVWDLIAVDKASGTFARVSGSANAMASGMDRAMARYTAAMRRTAVVGAGLTRRLTLPLVAIGAVSVKMASDFNASMTRIQTQAGASAKDVRFLTKAVLNMKDVQYAPNQLAEALYHLKSVGLDNTKAMKALRVATNLASVGGADLTDTTNALAGAWRTGIRGAKNFHDAAATVNAVIGAGNMTLTDFVSALGTGILPTAKTFGLTLKDVGSALALFTDEGVPADAAATRLRMSMSLLGAPSMAAEKQLKTIGLTGLKLANDMRKPNGLITAIGDLKAHLEDPQYKLSLSQQAQLLSHAFGGGRSSSAILSLINNFDVLKKKQDQVTTSLGKYDDAVKKQAETPEAQFKTLEATLGRSAILLGNQLLPLAIKITDDIASIGAKFNDLSDGQKKTIIYSGLALAALGPVLSIVGKIGTAFGLMWRAGASTSRFLAAMRGAQLSEEAMASGAYRAGARVNTAFGSVGTAAGRLVSSLASLGAGAVAGQIGGTSTGGWLTSIMLGGAGGWALGGPVGAAIGGVSAAIFKGIGLWNSHKDAAKTAAQAEIQWVNTLTDAINTDSGALGNNLRARVATSLQSSGVLDAAKAAGIKLSTVIDAAIGKTNLGPTIAQRINNLVEQAKSYQTAVAGQHNAVSGLTTANLLVEQLGTLKGYAAGNLPGAKGVYAVAQQIAALRNLAKALGQSAADTGKAVRQYNQLEHALNDGTAAGGRFAKQLHDLKAGTTEALDSNGVLTNVLKGQSVAAEKNRTTLTRLAQAAHDDATLTLQAALKHHSLSDALDIGNKKLAANEKAIRAAADAAGFDKGFVDKLIKSIQTLGKQDAKAKVSVIDEATAKIRAIQAEITGLRGKDLTIRINQINTSGVGQAGSQPGSRHYRGGATGFSNIPQGYSTINERGWELLHRQGNNVAVIPHKTSMAMTGLPDRLPGFASGTTGAKLSAADRGRAIGDIDAALRRFARIINSTGSAVRSSFSGLLDAFRTLGASHEALQRLTKEDNKLAKAVNRRNRDLDRLHSLVQARRQESGTIAGAVRGAFDLATAGGGPSGSGKPTFGTVYAQALQEKNLIKRWASGIRKLGKVFGRSPVGKAMLRRLAEAGPDSWPQVSALLSANPKQLQNLIATERQISSTARSVGGYVSGTLFNDRIAGARSDVARDRHAVTHELRLLRHDVAHLADALHVTLKVDGKTLATASATGANRNGRRK